MGVSFKIEDTMRIFQEIAFLLLPLLVVGQIWDDEDKVVPMERDGGIMDTSEKWECYVFGQCEEYSVNFEEIDNAESCHKFCGKNDDCKWWTWEPDNSLCSLFANCTDPKQSTGHPNAGPCSDCISGQQACPGRECHSPNKCQGHLVDTFETGHLEDCINMCKDTAACEWYTYDKKDDHCILYKDCESLISCDTCATGKKYCSKGYHGDDESVTEAVDDDTQVLDESWVCDWKKADWSQTFTLMDDGSFVHRRGFDLRKIWGPGGPGESSNTFACNYLFDNCPKTFMGLDMAEVCVASYGWFLNHY